MKPEEAFNQFYVWGDNGWSKSETPSSEALILAIQALEKQVAKKPILIKHPLPSKRDFKCPVCSGDVNRQWEYEHYDDRMIGEEQYEHCPDCGQKINWEETQCIQKK